jgi:predicted small integral membrane protein
VRWMYWTLPTALFFVAIAAILAGMTVWEIRSPSLPRRGALRLATTRGDRLFIGLLTSAYVHIGWVALTDQPPWAATIACIPLLIAALRWA